MWRLRVRRHQSWGAHGRRSGSRMCIAVLSIHRWRLEPAIGRRGEGRTSSTRAGGEAPAPQELASRQLQATVEWLKMLDGWRCHRHQWMARWHGPTANGSRPLSVRVRARLMSDTQFWASRGETWHDILVERGTKSKRRLHFSWCAFLLARRSALARSRWMRRGPQGPWPRNERLGHASNETLVVCQSASAHAKCIACGVTNMELDY